MGTRKLSELIFESSFAFIDGNFDLRIVDSDFNQIAIASETEDAYLLTSHYSMHNIMYTKHFLVTGEFSLLFRVAARVKINKTVTSMNLAHGFHIPEDVLFELNKEKESVYTVEGPPCDLAPYKKTISLTINFKGARGGMNISKTVWTIPKEIGDDWCDLFYRWASQ